MKTKEREKLVFQLDLTDARAAYNFPPDFAQFLVRQNREDLANAFLDWLGKYTNSRSDEELDLWEILRGAAQFAEINDISGLPFEDNDLLSPTGYEPFDEQKGDYKTAEEVLENLDRDVPDRVVPETNIRVEFEEGDDLAILLMHTIEAMRKMGHRRLSKQLAREIKSALRVRPSTMDIFKIIQTYVHVDVLPPERKDEERMRK